MTSGDRSRHCLFAGGSLVLGYLTLIARARRLPWRQHIDRVFSARPMIALSAGGELGRRCSMGCKTWPNTEAYTICPLCEDRTRLYRDVHPLTEKEAISIVRHAEFEHYYENEHVQDLDPLTDEELDKLNLSAEGEPAKPVFKVPSPVSLLIPKLKPSSRPSSAAGAAF